MFEQTIHQTHTTRIAGTTTFLFTRRSQTNKHNPIHKNKRKGNKKTNKVGLLLSEVALQGTSPDPKPSRTRERKGFHLTLSLPNPNRRTKPTKSANNSGITNVLAHLQLKHKKTKEKHHTTNHSKQNMQHTTQTRNTPFCILNSNPPFLANLLFWDIALECSRTFPYNFNIFNIPREMLKIWFLQLEHL